VKNIGFDQLAVVVRHLVHFDLVSSAEISQSTSIQRQLTNQLRGRLTNFTIRDDRGLFGLVTPKSCGKS